MNVPHDELPDPEGEPTPSDKDTFATVIWLSFAAVVAAGVFAPSMMSRGCTRGASRSSRIKWEERQTEIDASIRAERQADHPAPPNNADPK